jgi:hypothetical protein
MIVRSEGAAGGFFWLLRREEHYVLMLLFRWGGANAISTVLSLKTKHVLGGAPMLIV